MVGPIRKPAKKKLRGSQNPYLDDSGFSEPLPGPAMRKIFRDTLHMNPASPGLKKPKTEIGPRQPRKAKKKTRGA